jgi:hypothetical protein
MVCHFCVNKIFISQFKFLHLIFATCMMRLRIISLFLALVMAIQMIPVAQIGYALSNNVWTEEIPHNSSEDVAKGDCCVKTFIPLTTHHIISDVAFKAADIYIHTQDQIPSNHSTDVVTPPPDLMA